MSEYLQTPFNFAPGTVVSVSRGFYRHVGIVSDKFVSGYPTVISNSSLRGGVVEEPWPEFSRGQSVRADSTRSSLPAATVIARARSKIGTPYRFLDWNCEHLVSYACGFKPRSPQLATAALALVALFAVARA